MSFTDILRALGIVAAVGMFSLAAWLLWYIIVGPKDIP